MPTLRHARLLLSGLLVSASASWAQEAPAGEAPDSPRLPLSGMPARRLNIDHFVGAGYNPMVAEYRTRYNYTLRQGQSEELLWRDTFLSLGGQVRLNPAYTAVGPLVQWQPIAVFNLRALVDAYGFFGTVGLLQSFRSPLDDYSDVLQRTRAAAGENYRTTGWHAMLQPTLQAQLGPVAVQSIFTIDYFDIRLRGGDTLWFDAGPDTLQPGRGWVLTEEVNLVYLAGPWAVGGNFRYVLPLYTQEHFRPGEDRRAVDNSAMRAGLLVAYTFFDGGYSVFNHPAVFATATWHLRHRYRTGAETDQAIPFIALGFAFQQDFIF
jgi:hypothetical protein